VTVQEHRRVTGVLPSLDPIDVRVVPFDRGGRDERYADQLAHVVGAIGAHHDRRRYGIGECGDPGSGARGCRAARRKDGEQRDLAVLVYTQQGVSTRVDDYVAVVMVPVLLALPAAVLRILHEEAIRVAFGHPAVRPAADLVGGDVDHWLPAVVIAEVRGRSEKSTRRDVDELPEVRPVQGRAGSRDRPRGRR
jgi:hypothetical protein